MSEATETRVHPETLERDVDSIRCIACGTGYAEAVDPTPEETKTLGCGVSYACCNASFVCSACGVRIAARLYAPEME